MRANKKLQQAQISTDNEGFVSSKSANASGSQSRVEDSNADTVTDPLDKSEDARNRVIEEEDDDITPVPRSVSPMTLNKGKKGSDRNENSEKFPTVDRGTVSTLRKEVIFDSQERSLSASVVGKDGT